MNDKNTPSLHQLRVLATVASCGSVTKAAEQLFLSQPAVSNLLKQLEQHFGVPLFEIIRKKFYLTHAGETVCASYRQLRTELDSLYNQLNEIKGEVRGTLHIAMVSTAKYFIPKLVGEFQRSYPNLNVNLTINNRQIIFHLLRENQCDLGIVSLLPNDLPLIVEPFADNPLVIIADAKHRLAGQQQISIAELAKEKLLIRESGAGIRCSMLSLFSTAGLTADIVMELSSTEAIKQAVMAGIGISLVPSRCLELELNQDKVVILDVKSLPLHRKWYTAYPKGKKHNPVALKFIDYLHQQSKRI